MPPLPLLLLALAALAAHPAIAASNSTCYYPSHFVTPSLPVCTSACNTLLASKGVGSVYPEIYTKDSVKCCKCQYRNPAFAGDPSPAGDDSSASSKDDGNPASPSPGPSSKASPSPAPAAAKKKSTFKRVWWKVAIVIGVFIVIFCVTAAMLFWDCCKLRSSWKAARESVREGAKEELAKRKSKREGMSKDAQRRLAALDLARELRETKLEAQAQPPAQFVEVVVNASGPASAPSSPGTRSRQGRKRGFTTAAALV
ncbi:phosphatidate cytidylyltransferase [Chlorella sorokiniana]|uniref:Phosphatidate cytidylyltransferase n=1 Tax=Chlorella sorokiniana TaxID=3076 RepID=A0A2P6TMY9_CHLSO|nr:phosphatidate cytidylyltransferase [Chlorella sorokiniana]|eukprot:PRW45708.1 phosphatidate cytidylyltransferase [Chlorella sorokiniana]